MAADEGFTGLLHASKVEDLDGGKGRVGCYKEVLRLEDLTHQELLQLDSEGRCLVTDHGSFILFNIYGPHADVSDLGRQDFKLKFFKGLQSRWEGLLRKGRTILAVGDFNISPFHIDSCNPVPNFETSLSRRWLRSMLETGGGPFSDIFRTIHPDRREAFTCWSQASGAEEFNYGTRIDLILAAGPCTHHLAFPHKSNCHNFVTCEVEDSDILTMFKRWKSDSLPRWLGGRTVKLDGSDHAPVYVLLKPQPSLPHHDVPALAARFMPEIRGRQQSLVSFFQKKPVSHDSWNPFTSENRQGKKFPANDSQESLRRETPCRENVEVEFEADKSICQTGMVYHTQMDFKIEKEYNHDTVNELCVSGGPQCGSDSNNHTHFATMVDKIKIPQTVNHALAPKSKKRLSQSFTRKTSKRTSQSSLRSFLLKKSSSKATSEIHIDAQNSGEETRLLNVESGQSKPTCSSHFSLTRSNSLCENFDRPDEALGEAVPHNNTSIFPFTHDSSMQEDALQPSVGDDENEDESIRVNVSSLAGGATVSKNSKAYVEWQRLQQFMAQKVPLCEGHHEPCVSRVVKKAGANVGHGFYVCARAQGPTSNPEARCDHFEWASSKGKTKTKQS